jgi:hypothetical protein
MDFQEFLHIFIAWILCTGAILVTAAFMLWTIDYCKERFKRPK